jgi:hypothetical protein
MIDKDGTSGRSAQTGSMRQVKWRLALALLGDDVQQDLAAVGLARIAPYRQQMVKVITVARSSVVQCSRSLVP